jgi:hypothetical protein
MKTFAHFLLLLAIFGLLACGSKKQTCASSPQAMFTPDMRGVEQQQFKLIDPVNSEEEIVLKNGHRLNILQSGCEKLRQEFRFSIPGRMKTDSALVWAELAIRELSNLALMDQRLLPMGQWAMAINSKKGEIRLAETLSLGQGFYVKIDRIPSAEDVILLVVFSNFED